MNNIVIIIDPVETMKYQEIGGIMGVLNLSKKRISQVPLSDSVKSIILGSLLGDGSLRIDKGYKNARFIVRHSWIQKEYFY